MRSERCAYDLGCGRSATETGLIVAALIVAKVAGVGVGVSTSDLRLHSERVDSVAEALGLILQVAVALRSRRVKTLDSLLETHIFLAVAVAARRARR